MRSRALLAIARGLWLFLLLASTSACGDRSDEATAKIVSWTLVVSGKPERTVELPAHFDADLPKQRSSYVLRASVPILPAWRGRALTLAIPHFPGVATLRVDGEPARSLESHREDRYRCAGAHSWGIAPAHTVGRDTLELEILVDHAWIPSGWFDTVPRLSASAEGDAGFLFVTTFNRWTLALLLGVTLALLSVYLMLFLFDRRRRTYGWFALQATTSLQYAIFSLGIAQPLLGRFDGAINKMVLCVGGVGSVCFTYAYFELGRVPRFFGLAAATVTAISLPLAIVSSGKFGNIYLAPEVATGIFWGIVGTHQVFLLWRVLRKDRRRADALMLALGWIAWALCVAPEAVAWMGLGEVMGGVHLTGLGLTVFAFLQAAMLSRAHIASNQRADALNLELAGRVKLLLDSNEEVRVLNEELRRQVASRSRQLTDALARIGEVAERGGNLATGDVVQARYRVVRAIGAGGMGKVYEVERLSDARRMALKMMQGPADGPSLARFAREAEIAAQVSHDNLVSIHDVDVSEDGSLFTVMELVDGMPLAGMAERYGDVRWALPILAQVAAGLAALHAQGVVHRDLKPANVLLTRGKDSIEIAKIADFGIARMPDAIDLAGKQSGDAFAAGSTPTLASSTPHLTKTGILLGTPLYMAPELARGAKEAKPSSDLWSFGVMAFEVLLGRFPFSVNTPPVIDAFAGRAWTRPKIAPTLGMDPRLLELIEACLSPEASHRPSAAEMAAMMKSIASATTGGHSLIAQASPK